MPDPVILPGAHSAALSQYDLGIAWEWEYDSGFVRRLEKACSEAGLTTLTVHPGNLDQVTEGYRHGHLYFGAYLDRGSDALKEFVPLARLVAASGSRIINNYAAMQWAMDKATMHLELITAGLHVPYTIILSPYSHEPEIQIHELHKLGRPFIIKPAVGGGGTGVVTDAETLADVLQARTSQNRQKYLLQRKVTPVLLGERRAWFRAYSVMGETFLVWWNDITHFYEYLGLEEECEHALSPMREIITRIAHISGLDFFSAEIALDENRRFVVVDYVNDVCDMRAQSRHPDGVPDRLVGEIIAALVGYLARRRYETVAGRALVAG